MTTLRGRPFRTRLFMCSSAASLLLAAGCANMTNPLSTESRINRYFEKHPDRPPAIQAAVRNHTVCKGMTPEEMKFSWGAPDSIEPTEVKGVREEIWSYVEHHKGGTSSDHGSGLFDYDVPLKRAILVAAAAQGLSLSEWTIYGEEDDGKSGSSQPAADPTKANSAPAAPASAATAEAPASRMPEVTPNVDLKRWPALKLTGILKSGQSQVALINNRLVSPGETVEGATVLAISPVGVYLQLGAETICLTKGAETHPPAPARRSLFN